MAKSRIALDELLEAFEKHYEIVADESSTDDEILEAEDELLNAFFVYDDSLFIDYGVEIPIDLLADDFFEELEEDVFSQEKETKFSAEYDEDEDTYELDEDI